MDHALRILVWWTPRCSYSSSSSNSLWPYKNLSEILADHLGTAYINWPICIQLCLISISTPCGDELFCELFCEPASPVAGGRGCVGKAEQDAGGTPAHQELSPSLQPSPPQPVGSGQPQRQWALQNVTSLLCSKWVPKTAGTVFSRVSKETIHFKGK